MQWLLAARVDRARELLEASDAPMEVVAGSPDWVPRPNRTLFRRQAGVCRPAPTAAPSAWALPYEPGGVGPLSAASRHG